MYHQYRIGKCKIHSNFKSMTISQLVSIVRVVSNENRSIKMAPNKPRKIASTKAKVAQNAPKESHKKRKVIDKNDEAESESGDTMGSAAELKENAVNTEIVSSGGSSDESVPVKKQSRKRKSQAVTKKPPKKKELEFDIKTKLASAISKHANLFDVNNSKYSDSRAENASWKDISKSIGVSIDDCMKHWASLKRSASNFARPARIPFKSGAPGNELDDGDDKKYKDEWQFADVMNFYTPPALKKHEKLISARNPSTSTENDGESDAFWHNEANTMDSFEIIKRQ